METLKPPGPFPKDAHPVNRCYSESCHVFKTKYGPGQSSVLLVL